MKCLQIGAKWSDVWQMRNAAHPMGEEGYSDAQRLAFGSVAELYERARPSYPLAAIDEALTHADAEPGELVLEVGAGTGKATRLIAERGLRVIALEPDARMAALARRSCSELQRVQVLELDFESYRAGDQAALVLAAQSWHWVDADVRYQSAARALRPGGSLAALWTLPRWQEVPLRDQLREVYGRLLPQMGAGFPMHPASNPDDLAGDWHEEIGRSSGFEDALVSEHVWTLEYSASAYAELLSTHQDHILLDPHERDALLDGVRAAIDGAGGTLALPFTTSVCLARRRS